MDIIVNITDKSFLRRLGSPERLPSLDLGDRDQCPGRLFLTTEALSPIQIPAPYTEATLTARPNDRAQAAPLFLFSTTSPPAGEGSTLHYPIQIATRTAAIVEIFAAAPKRASYPCLVDIDLIGAGTRRSVVHGYPCRIHRTIWSGNYSEPSEPIFTAPPVLVVAAPTTPNDWSMFPGGVAPSSGSFEATDAGFLYRYSAGDAEWTRIPRAAWEPVP